MWHVYNGILFSHEKERNFAISDNVDFEGIMLSVISQREKDKYHIISLICGILKHQTPRNRDWNSGYQGICWSKGTKFQL